ncbi:MAG TPA: S8 family serine peptidase [Candidatus Thermoplasmatota archaeon]|nr:S8 family serine peptidase [Candidatus Thermoplasmatota archaeon]
MALRGRALAIVAVLAAVPLSGCLDILSAGSDGYGETWPLEMVQAQALHDRDLTGAGVTVAIIDTGIDLSHPEFDGVPVRWADLVGGQKSAYDDNGHGTHVAGIIAAQGRWSTMFSGFRLKGVAPEVSLIVIKAIDHSGEGDESRVAQGIQTAVSNGADIIVLSLGGQTRAIFGTNTESKVREAIQQGVYVIAAAGNTKDGETDCTVNSPASVEGVIAVGAVDRDGRIGAFSCRGTGKEGAGTALPGLPSPVRSSVDPHKKPEVVAPGVQVLSTWSRDKGSEYALADGTSQAAPMVAGVLALVLQAKPHLSRDGNQGESTVVAVKSKLMSTAAKIGPLAGKGPTAHDERYGYGLVQGEALLLALG